VNESEEMFVSSSCLTKIFDSTRNRQEEIFILPSCSARDFGVHAVHNKHIGFRMLSAAYVVHPT
jgi:hypothetical protein